MKKINMGCGPRNFGKDWIHIDGGNYSHLDYHNIVNLPFENESIDLIYSSHVIEYFDQTEIDEVLKEWNRVLKTKGVLRVCVPDFEVMSRLYLTGNFPIEKFLGPLYGRMKMGQNSIYHKTVYDFSLLEKVLLRNGFKKISRYDWKATDHSNFDDHSQAYLPHMDKENGTLISLNVECIKGKND